ncbi:MAG: hypothetical protein IKU60_03830 [Clostridia bacterium]|nr:hypothetical protein [Clostridia bacterium]
MKKWIKVKFVFNADKDGLAIKHSCSRSGLHPKLYMVAVMGWLSVLVEGLAKTGDMSKAEICDAVISFLEDVKEGKRESKDD